MNLIYLHELSSSAQSNSAKKLRAHLPNDNVVTPDIPISPIKALQLLLSLVGKYQADNTIVIGTSMSVIGANEETVELVYGNRFCQTPSIEIYGANGVQVTDVDFIINDNIIVHRATENNG